MEQVANNKRIAKNTMFLYLRMGFSMIVSLYTSRVVLKVLGVSDYGVYAVIGGLVSSLVFINGSLASSTIRYISFELGKGNGQKLKETFSSAFILHLLLGIIALIFLELIENWLVGSFLSIDKDRILAAKWVYQFSIFAIFVNFTQIPYNACVIAHEKMNAYAYIEIVNTMLKLLIVYLLVIGNFDKLILYSILTFSVSLFITIVYRAYCIKNFTETKFKWIFKREVLYPMLTFSGWNILWNAGWVGREQGLNLLINKFFGTVMNASASIATQVQGAVIVFANNVFSAAKPQIIKLYAAGAYEEVAILVRRMIIYDFIILALLTIPLLSEMNFILHLWLGKVPQYTSIFCSSILIFNFFKNSSLVFECGIDASERIKSKTILESIIYLSVLPITYILFNLGYNAWISYIVNVIAIAISMFTVAIIFSKRCDAFNLKVFIVHDFILCVLIFTSSIIILQFLNSILMEGWLRLFTAIIISSLFVIISSYSFLIPKNDKKHINMMIKKNIFKCK